jgi:hypothetical protein
MCINVSGWALVAVDAELDTLTFNDKVRRTEMNKWRVIATNIFGVQLFAVESDGCILKYCDTKEDAEMCIREMEEDDE